MSATGLWILEIESPLTPRPFELRLSQVGSHLTGTLLQQGAAGLPTEIDHGSVDGDRLTWSTSLPIQVDYTGVLRGDHLRGSARAAGNDLPFSAARQV